MHHLAPRAAATMLVLVVSIAVVGQRGRPSAAQLSLGVRAETTQKPKSQPSTGLPAAGPALAVHDYVIIKRDSSESGAPRIIVVKTRTKAEEILVALGKGRSFSTQAIVYFSHPSAKEGGVLDGESLLALPSEVRAAYERLKPGECSDAIEIAPIPDVVSWLPSYVIVLDGKEVSSVKPYVGWPGLLEGDVLGNITVRQDFGAPTRVYLRLPDSDAWWEQSTRRVETLSTHFNVLQVEALQAVSGGTIVWGSTRWDVAWIRRGNVLLLIIPKQLGSCTIVLSR